MKQFYLVYLKFGNDILVARNLREVSFPAFSPTDCNLAQVYQVNTYLRKIMDSDVFVCRPLLSALDVDEFVVLYECDFVELHSVRPEPHGEFEWVPIATLAESLAKKSEKLLAENAAVALRERTSTPLESFGRLSRDRFARICEELQRTVQDDAGQAPMLIEQFRHWDRSSLFRCIFKGTGEPQFAKFVPTFLAAEKIVASWLASRFPLNSVRVRTELKESGCYVMDALPQGRLENRPDVEMWKRTLALHAKIQCSAQEDIASGSLKGVPVRDLKWLRGVLSTLFVIEDLRSIGLHDDEVQVFRSAIPKIWKILDAFDGMSLPISLVHGDLWPGNVALDGERIVIFDWSDACIAPAFLDLVNCLMDIEVELGSEGVSALPSLVNAYGSEWADVFPTERLIQSYDALRVLTHAHSAAFYWAVVLPGITHQWQLRNMLPHHLCKMMEALEKINE